MTKYALTNINPNLKMNVQKNGYSREYLNKVREANGLPAKNNNEQLANKVYRKAMVSNDTGYLLAIWFQSYANEISEKSLLEMLDEVDNHLTDEQKVEWKKQEVK